MLPLIPKPAISSRRKAAAVMIAGIADLLQIICAPIFIEGFLSPLDDLIDVMTAIILMAICGFKWQFVAAFSLELLPFMDILPTWTAVALLLPTMPDEASQNRVNVQVVSREGREIIDTQAVSVPPVQAPPVRTQGGPV